MRNNDDAPLDPDLVELFSAFGDLTYNDGWEDRFDALLAADQSTEDSALGDIVPLVSVPETKRAVSRNVLVRIAAAVALIVGSVSLFDPLRLFDPAGIEVAAVKGGLDGDPRQEPEPEPLSEEPDVVDLDVLNGPGLNDLSYRADRQVLLQRGERGPSGEGWWFSVLLLGFDQGEEVTLSCSDSVDDDFWATTVVYEYRLIRSLCWSADRPVGETVGTYSVTARVGDEVIESNQAQWSTDATPLTPWGPFRLSSSPLLLSNQGLRADSLAFISRCTDVEIQVTPRFDASYTSFTSRAPCTPAQIPTVALRHPVQLERLDPGWHEFVVRASDGSGEVAVTTSVNLVQPDLPFAIRGLSDRLICSAEPVTAELVGDAVDDTVWEWTVDALFRGLPSVVMDTAQPTIDLAFDEVGIFRISVRERGSRGSSAVAHVVVTSENAPCSGFG